MEADLLPCKHGRKGQKKKWVKFTWKFCWRLESQRSHCPQWGASFTIYYQESGHLARGQSRWGFFTDHDNPWIFFELIDTTQ